jgi:hypothetical protein
MPALRHFHRGRPFDIMESEVAAWLCDQPELRQEIFNWCKRLGCILYIEFWQRGAFDSTVAVRTILVFLLLLIEGLVWAWSKGC